MPSVLKIVDDHAGDESELPTTLDELAREGARRMLEVALGAEVTAYIERHADELDEAGHRLVVRHGHAQPWRVTVGSGTIPVRAPRVNDRRMDDEGRRQRFTNDLLPPYMPHPRLRIVSSGASRGAQHKARRGPLQPAPAGDVDAGCHAQRRCFP